MSTRRTVNNPGIKTRSSAHCLQLVRRNPFTFIARDQQATSTLPVGAEALADSDGDFPFTERMTYDARGRQLLHISFEGVVTENVYDAYGRLSEMRYYQSEADFDAAAVSETRRFYFDGYGRSAGNDLVDASGEILRSERAGFDNRGRVLYEASPEG